MRVQNMRQLAASRRGRASRPMSQGGLVAVAIVVGALIVGAVLVGIYWHRSAEDARARRQADEALKKLEALTPPVWPGQ